jgi:protein-disulfide isomerase
MRIFNRDRRETGKRDLTISAMLAGLPIAFLLGMLLGYQLWGKSGVIIDADQQTVNSFVDIPIDENDFVYGPADADVVVIEFTDYQCPYCQRYYMETFQQIIETYGDRILYVVKDLPLVTIHPEALPAAVAAHCAGEQDAFWEYHDLLFNQAYGLNDEAYQLYAEALGLDMSAFTSCVDSGRYNQVVLEDTDVLEANRVPLSTPTFFINGTYLAGAQPFSVFAQAIDAELAAAE